MRTALIIAIVLFILWRLDVVRRGAILSKRLSDANLPEEEEKTLWHLSQKVANRAIKEGVYIPRNNFVCKLNIDDPYTWVILKVGFRREKEIYRCRVSIEDITECQRLAHEEIVKGKEEA